MYEVFAEKGYSTSMSDISQKVSLKPQSIYSHFESKDQIVWIAIEKEIEAKYEYLQKSILEAEKGSCEKSLERITLAIYQYFEDYERLKFWRKIPLIQNDDLRKKCRDRIKIFDEQIYSQIVRIFQSGVAVGEIKSNNIEGIMNLYVAMIQEILDGMLLYNNHNVDMKAYAKKTWEAYWDGIRIINK